MANYSLNDDTIAALATPYGFGAIAVIRLSGKQAISITENVFYTKKLKHKTLADKASHTAHFGLIAEHGGIIYALPVNRFRSIGQNLLIWF